MSRQTHLKVHILPYVTFSLVFLSMVDADGFEPAAYLTSLIYSQLPSTVWLRIHELFNEFYL